MSYVRIPFSMVGALLVASMWADGLPRTNASAAILVLILWPYIWLFAGRRLFPRRSGAFFLIAMDGMLLGLIPVARWGLPLLNLGLTVIFIHSILTGGMRLLLIALGFVVASMILGTMIWGFPVTPISYSARTWLLSTAAVVIEGVLSAMVAFRANTMLTKTKRELAELNTILDRKVLERTAALADTNAAISRFVPREFLQALGHDNVTTAKLGDAVARDLTVLFADIRNFTTLSEQLTPHQTFHFLNTCLSKIGPHIRAQSGFIDKYIGDAIMALFPESPVHAVRAAIAMQQEVMNFNRANPEQTKLALGIGIHFGRVTMGTIGEQERFEATVIADAVNLTARLETLTKQLGCSVIVSAEVAAHLGAADRADMRVLGRFAVKGKSTAVEVMEIFAADPEPLRAVKRATRPEFEHGLRLYAASRLLESAAAFQKLVQRCPDDGPASFWLARARLDLERCALVPTDGVVNLDQK